MRPGTKNLITDIPGFLVGNASDSGIKTGCTVLTAEKPFTAAVHVMGGAPGTRETDLLAPENTVQNVDALVLSGGSAFGLDAASGAVAELRARGRGFQTGTARVPIVPAAIILDVGRAGGADWDDPPWKDLGRAAFKDASADFAIGTAGAGTGATCANLKGGLGSASAVLDTGVTVGALVVANPIGQVTVGDGPAFWAAPFEQDDEFGGIGLAAFPGNPPPTKVEPQGATAIAIVATDLALSKPEAKRMAVMAHDGIARAIVPSHTPFDGDLVFAASTGQRQSANPDLDLIRVGHAAATCLARAIARAVYEATPDPGDPKPTWRTRFGR
ncbi:MAG: P1 family peptidase [Pseudomonadota bacterium]